MTKVKSFGDGKLFNNIVNIYFKSESNNSILNYKLLFNLYVYIEQDVCRINRNSECSFRRIYSFALSL
jgi:hypothetical protein